MQQVLMWSMISSAPAPIPDNVFSIVMKQQQDKRMLNLMKALNPGNRVYVNDRAGYYGTIVGTEYSSGEVVYIVDKPGSMWLHYETADALTKV